ncbi:hypothetical protein [Mycolicibacterium tusciae]|uniref:hypothetical protein n=1 Tax=Mycolicibacterium tusciae TaxID=75922 RepID=UPI00024A3F0A|nr:hypothetical protein [Mycolicibacterium tusciae]
MRSVAVSDFSVGGLVGRRSSMIVTGGFCRVFGVAACDGWAGESLMVLFSVTPGWLISSHAAPTTLMKGWESSVPLASSVRVSLGSRTMVLAAHSGVVTW